MKDKKIKILAMMKKYGGGFASKLADAALYADDSNYEILKDAFPELWEQYEQMAEAREEQHV